MSHPDERRPPSPEAAWRGVEGRLQQLLRSVSRALAAGGGADVVLQACCQALVDHVDAAFARIWTLPPGDGTLRLEASAGMYTRLDGTYARVRVGDAKIGQIASDRRPHLTNNVAGDRRIVDHAWARQTGMVAFAGLPLVADEEVVGVMALFARHPLQAAVLTELDSVASTVAQFIGRERAGSIERHRLAQELHDTVSQGLYAVKLAAEAGLREAHTTGQQSTMARQFEEVIGLTDGAQAELRALILGIRPDSIERDGLLPSLAQLVKGFSARYQVPVEARLDVEPAVGASAKQALYRLAQEALTNAGRHAGASRVIVALRQAGTGYELSVEDDGSGFTVEDRPGHVGLRTMRERARAHGWRLEVQSVRGTGSRVRVLFGPVSRRASSPQQRA